MMELKITTVHGNLKPNDDPEIVSECDITIIAEGEKDGVKVKLQLEITEWGIAGRLAEAIEAREISASVESI